MPTIQFFCVICGTALHGKTDAHDDVIECHSCAHQVPVPRLVKMPGRLAGCAAVFPPDVLALEVKFLCTACQSPLRADARWEGRGVICPVCGDKTGVPHWSEFTQRTRTADFSGTAKLSSEEIEFLSQSVPASPGAAA